MCTRTLLYCQRPLSLCMSSLVPRLSRAAEWKDSLDKIGRFLGYGVAKTGKPIRLLEERLSHDYRMASVVLTGAPYVHSSRRATLYLTDLARLAKQQVYYICRFCAKTTVWLHKSHQELMHVRIRLRHGFQ